MPVEYRRQLIRMISQHAHSEIDGMLAQGAWIACDPSLRRKMILPAAHQKLRAFGLGPLPGWMGTSLCKIWSRQSAWNEAGRTAA